MMGCLNDTHEMNLCIECEGGIMEDLPATFEIDEDHGTARLLSFRIGAWEGDRDAAIAMTGAEHVQTQESNALEAWHEAAEERAMGEADYRYEMRRDAELEYL